MPEPIRKWRNQAQPARAGACFRGPSRVPLSPGEPQSTNACKACYPARGRAARTGQRGRDCGGRVLYLFARDRRNASSCHGGWAAAWPPDTVSRAPKAGAACAAAFGGRRAVATEASKSPTRDTRCMASRTTTRPARSCAKTSPTAVGSGPSSIPAVRPSVSPAWHPGAALRAGPRLGLLSQTNPTERAHPSQSAAAQREAALG